MKMKKFFGLKMTLAALAVVSFASCYDSEGGDVIIPNQTTVDWPDPVYVVVGHVTDSNGAGLSEVNIYNLNVGQMTDLNGDYTVTMNSPFSGDVDFTKEGYFRTTRTLKMATMKTGSAVYNLDATMWTLDEVTGALKEKNVVMIPDETEAVDATADALAAETGIDFTNTTDNAAVYDFWAGSLYAAGADPLPYGVKAVVNKSLEEEGQVAFLKWFNSTNFRWYQESPYGDYGKFDGRLTVVIPAMFKVTKIVAIPVLTEKTLVFPLLEGDYEVPVEIYESYQVEVEGVALTHDHGHAHGNTNGAGGGEGN